MSEQVGGLTKGIGSAFRTVVIIYAIAIGFTVVLLVLSAAFGEIFKGIPNPFVFVYNSVRNITIFLMVFPPAFGLVVAAWFLDLILPILFEILNGFMITFKIPIELPTEFDLVTTAEGLVETIEDLVNTLFPPLTL